MSGSRATIGHQSSTCGEMATGALAERCSCKYPVNRIQHIIRNVFISGYCSVWPRNYRQVNLNPFFYIFFVSV